jgi:hypothetical protein
MIEIKKPNGSGLKYPILQDTIDLSQSNFGALNTNPLQILPAFPGYYLVICDMFIQWDNFSNSPFYIFYITFETSIGQWVTFNGTINGTIGGYILQRFNSWQSAGNTFIGEKFVLKADADNSLLIFNKFIVTINYMLIPNLSI